MEKMRQPATCPSDEVENIRRIIGSLNFVPGCGNGLWYPVAHLNMSHPSQQCPSNWSEYSSSGVRACRRQPSRSNGSIPSCDGVLFSIGRQYNRICGRVLGYQLDSVNAFTDPIVPEFVSTARAIDGTIDGAYVDGMSITHGLPRNHIWTFAAGNHPNALEYTCPCIYNCTGPGPQQFVGNHYFCESSSGTFTPTDKLWDGQQCSDQGTYCNTASLPWFIRDLPNSTSDDIEVRICGDENTANEDTPVELVEIYIQLTKQ